MKSSKLMLKLLNNNLDEQVKVIKEKQATIEALEKAKERLQLQLEQEKSFIEKNIAIRNFDFSNFMNYNANTQGTIQSEIHKLELELNIQKEVLKDIFIQIKQIEIIDKKARNKINYLQDKAEQNILDEIAIRKYINQED